MTELLSLLVYSICERTKDVKMVEKHFIVEQAYMPRRFQWTKTIFIVNLGVNAKVLPPYDIIEDDDNVGLSYFTIQFKF